MTKKSKVLRRSEGRPSKFSKVLADSICNFIRLGSWLEVAAEANGIERTTLYLWLRRGSAYLAAVETGQPIVKDVEYANFTLAVRKATAEAELLDLERIDTAAEQVWQAAAWKLERRYPDRYGQRSRYEVTGRDGQPIQSEVKVLSDNERAAAVYSLLSRLGQIRVGPLVDGEDRVDGSLLGEPLVVDDGSGDVTGPLAGRIAPLFG